MAEHICGASGVADAADDWLSELLPKGDSDDFSGPAGPPALVMALVSGDVDITALS